MTIRQQGGIFGRRPTFENLTVDGTLIVDQVVERTPAAGITLEGVTLKDGHVALASGKGIDFSASAGGGTSELLDDYEEGTFTATIVGSSSAGTATYSAQNASYTKIGRMVSFQIYLVWSSGTGTGDLYVGGLPFTSAGSSLGFGSAVAISSLNVTLTTGNYAVGGYVLSTNNRIRLLQNTVGGGTTTSIPYDTAGEMILAGSYFV